jgi:methylated-DNA-[protein]-cysteine S-methyltransferase
MDGMTFLIDRLDTPIGELLVVSDREGRLRAVHWQDHESQLLGALRRQCGTGAAEFEPASNPGGFTAALRAYFDGDLAAIAGLPVESSGTPFQHAVWTVLREIPCGTTMTYGEVARRINRPSAVRAVGLANGANPVGIVVPCHRVIGANGTLTGYGGGIDRKRWLLAHEAGHTGYRLTATGDRHRRGWP